MAIFFLFPSKEFLSISFKIPLLETSPQKQKEQRQKQLGADKLVPTQIWKLKNLMSLFYDLFPSCKFWKLCNIWIINLEINIYLKRIWKICQKENCPVSNLTIEKYTYKLLSFLKRLQRLKQEWQKSQAETRQTDGKNMVWFGEIERKLAKIIKCFVYLPLFLLVILWALAYTKALHLNN